MEFVSVFDEAGRDAESEVHLKAVTAAQVEAQACWPFLALAQSEAEFGHRLALSEDRLTSIAARHGVSFEDVTAQFRTAFEVLHPKEAATDPDILRAIQRRDPDGISPTPPTDADYDAHQKWAVDTYGQQAWDDYRQPGWDDPHHDDTWSFAPSRYNEYHGSKEAAAVKCAECGHASLPHQKGSECHCGCQNYTPQTTRAAAKEGDPRWDQSVSAGHYCSSCAPSYQRVSEPTKENPCKGCGGVGWKGEGGKKTSAKENQNEGDRYQCPDCHGTPMWFDMDKGRLQTCQGACGGSGVVYRTRREDSEGGYSRKDFDFHPAPKDAPTKKKSSLEERIASLSDADRFDATLEIIKHALQEGQDPLAWLGGESPVAPPSHHDTTEQFAGGNPVALDAAMQGGGGSAQPENPGGHSETQQMTSAKEHKHAWTERSRGDIIDGADPKLCGHCGKPKDADIHKTSVQGSRPF